MAFKEDLERVDEELKEQIKEIKYGEEVEKTRELEEERKKLIVSEDERCEGNKTHIENILYDTSDKMDIPHVYEVMRTERVMVNHGCYANRTYIFRMILTERELQMINTLNIWEELTNAYKNENFVGERAKALRRTGISRIRRIRDKNITEEERLRIQAARKKIEIIKNSIEEPGVAFIIKDGNGGVVVKTDELHAALCSLNYKSDNIRTAERKPKESWRMIGDIKYDELKDHPVRYTFKQIKNALKSRRRGRE